jgi:hypothetical protein
VTKPDMIELPDEGDYVAFRIDGGVIREGFIEQYNYGFSGYPTSFSLTDNPYIRYPIAYLVENRILEE